MGTSDVSLIRAIIAVHEWLPADPLAADPALGEGVAEHDGRRKKARVAADVLVLVAVGSCSSLCSSCDRSGSASAVLDKSKAMADGDRLDEARVD